MVVLPMVRITTLTQCPYIYGHFSPHRRQSIISSLIKAEAEARDLHFAHTGSKGVEYTLPATKTPSTWECEHTNQYIEQYNTQLHPSIPLKKKKKK